MPSIVAPGQVRRVILVVLDGLRPDAVPRFRLDNVLHLARIGAATFNAQTIAPSVTSAAMATLLTGATPDRHGLDSSRLRIPRSRGPLHPLPRELSRMGLPTSVFMHRIPWIFTGFAKRAAERLGVEDAHFGGREAIEILAAARERLLRQREGLIVLHWPDADLAGHDHGWMSPQYGAGARQLDFALGVLLQLVDVSDPGTLLVAVADHGGGGRWLRDHDSDHPDDRTIPVLLAGGAVQPGGLGPDVRLEDVPATICQALGVPLPSSFAGNVLMEHERADQSAA
ncbi:MAG: alkaline phosphatase family protein [Gemmatimonadales bacterium]